MSQQSAKATAGKEATALAGPPANPFQREDEQYLTAVKWLIGALGAIAAVLVAGVQLSSVGALRWPEDQGRLLLAAASFTLVLTCVVLAVGLLAWAHMPEKGSDLDRLHEIVETRSPSAVLDAVRRDSSYHRGTGGLGDLLTAMDKASRSFYAARGELSSARLAAAEAKPPATGESVAVQQAAARVEEWSESYGRLREGARRVSHLDRHLRIAQRAKGVLTGVLLLTFISAVSLGAFSWAAHPPDRAADPQEAVPPRPVSALLLLSDDDPVWEDRLGEGCAEAAREGGVPVVALSSSAEEVEVLVLEGGECPAPRVVAVPTDAGTVESADDVTTG
ncbi:hypothetical protein [Serinicoccus sediminis]|uniref:hypothetical protein n=1 Tax=Serinicoccus sediminis TaxID=2306021 RepID=UPI00101F17B8|nr:hypothetical protein [Serinicoccus sediminis]